MKSRDLKSYVSWWEIEGFSLFGVEGGSGFDVGFGARLLVFG